MTLKKIIKMTKIDGKFDKTDNYKMIKMIVWWFHEIRKVIKFLLIVSETEVETSP